ncbi:MAG TPA: CapA family protein [Actinomycetota bacterium]|nr:CapA family protein [Actinomycetota bacterium]
MADGGGPGRGRRSLAAGAAVLGVALATAVWAVARDPSPERGRSPPGATGPGVSAPTPPAVEPSPRTTPRPRPRPRGRLVIHGTGDVSLDPHYVPNFLRYGFGYAWSGLGALFRRDDLTVVNLECPVSTLGSPVEKRFTFRGDPAALPAMRRAGVEVANLGNNHAYDYGPEALLDTLRNLRAHRIAPVGAGADGREATRAAVFRLRGWRVAVVGIGNVVEPEPESVAGPGKPGVACNDDVRCMVRAVRRADRRADLVVVSIHWGVELQPEPRADQVAMARAMIDAGADVIFGHHSHRLGSVGSYRGRPIFWSLGNFVWPRLSAAGARTAVAEVVVAPGGRIQARLLPVEIEDSGHPVLLGR